MDIVSSGWRHRVSKEWRLLQTATAGHPRRFYPFNSNSKYLTSYITIIVIIGIIIILTIKIIIIIISTTTTIIINIMITVTATSLQ
jgi:hypothetical protein